MCGLFLALLMAVWLRFVHSYHFYLVLVVVCTTFGAFNTSFVIIYIPDISGINHFLENFFKFFKTLLLLRTSCGLYIQDRLFRPIGAVLL